MALDARIRELGSRHQSLEQAIQDEMRRPYADDIKLKELKRQKLRLKEEIETLRGHRSRGVIMQNHGPFTIGTNAKDAVKAAVMLEDVARTVHIAREAGPLIPIPQDKIDALYNRYQNVYGQSTDDRR